MSSIRVELVFAALNRTATLIDYNIYNDIHKQHEFKKQIVLADESLTNDEKAYAIRELTKTYDKIKIMNNEGTRRICENCNQECFATLYCEYCVRNYLKESFSNWTSGNYDIDNLIQRCQLETLRPNVIVEWIPYNDFRNIYYLTKGGFSEIYTAVWINGGYEEWDSEKKQLIRFGSQKVVLKGLENVESANQSWFEEAKSHLIISNKWPHIIQCFGLTQNLSNGNYMLVMDSADIDLRRYLQQNHNQLTWKERINIIYDITVALGVIHSERAIHRDLHSGNILYSQLNQVWFISDLGFCGPADKSSTSIYGNLPYIAPEVIVGREFTFASDIYSIAILMWEISSGQTPFINFQHENDIVMNVINGIRPKIVPGTPLIYKNLMKECWNADPLKRPDINTLIDNTYEMLQFFREINETVINYLDADNLETNYASSKLFTSKLHQFENLPEPRNATIEEQEEFYSKLYNFNSPNNIDDFNGSNKQESKSSKINNIFKDNSKKLSKLFKKLQINSNNDNKEIIQQVKRQNIDINDKMDEIHNNPNLHHPEKDELEIPNAITLQKLQFLSNVI
ncbi:kinase-like domain-containing protein [Rhizophagus diaphanus]|nr:kinase-like domain-containing protein [Rhizophagus diaphanus] [Rhizophagus sp. MUCL 43196]